MRPYSVTDLSKPLIPTRRYLVASRAEAALYESNVSSRFHFVKRILNGRANRNHAEEQPGHHGKITHGDAEVFARVIARELVKEYQDKTFDDLILIAEPVFLGMLRRFLPARVRAVVVDEIARDFAPAADEAIYGLIAERRVG